MAKKDGKGSKKHKAEKGSEKGSDKKAEKKAEEKRLKKLERRLEEAVAAAEHAAEQAAEAARRLTQHAREIAAKPVEGGAVIPSRVRKGEPIPGEELETHTRQELLELAREADVTGRSSMTKAELVKALRG